MASLLERCIESIDQRLIVLAPPNVSVPAFFGNVTHDPSEHRMLLREIQKLRGTVYLNDGALQRNELTADGLHQTCEDEHSWHMMLLNARGLADACIWYREHPNTSSIQDLRVRNCPLAALNDSRDVVRAAVEAELTRARREQIPYSEVGGWAVSEGGRCTPEGLLMILATFSLSRVFGGALGLATATARHSSAAILRRLGLSPLDLPGLPGATSSYFDPRYNCEMELLRFDTRRSNPRYEGLIEALRARMAQVAVLAAGRPARKSPTAPAEAAA